MVRTKYPMLVLLITPNTPLHSQVDHEKRDGLEHKIERELVTGSLKEVVEGETTINPVVSNELRARNIGGQNDANI